MHVTFIQKLKNYARLYKLHPEERAEFEQIRQEIVNNPDKLKQIIETHNLIFGNYYDAAYTMESSIKLILVQGSGINNIFVPASNETISFRVYTYQAYIVMPNGKTVIDLSATKRAKLLFNTAQRQFNKNKTHNIIKTNDFDGITTYITNFINQYNHDRQ